MLFAVIYTARGNSSEESEKRSLQLFANWTPPAGFEFKSHYSFADGTGGIAIVDAQSAEAVLEAHAPWGPFFNYRTVPVVDVEASIPIFDTSNAWRDSVS